MKILPRRRLPVVRPKVVASKSPTQSRQMTRWVVWVVSMHPFFSWNISRPRHYSNSYQNGLGAIQFHRTKHFYSPIVFQITTLSNSTADPGHGTICWELGSRVELLPFFFLVICSSVRPSYVVYFFLLCVLSCDTPIFLHKATNPLNIPPFQTS